MSNQDPNPATGNGTRQQPSNADCRHDPQHLVVEFAHVCKHCGVTITARDCDACDGTGVQGPSEDWCVVCNGLGIDRWEVVK